MNRIPVLVRFAAVAAVLSGAAAPVWAQRGSEGFVTGEVEAAWTLWQEGLAAISAGKMDEADAAFG
jgi:hypothetical protein